MCSRLVAELPQVRRGDLAQVHRVDRREAEVEHLGPEPVALRVRVLLQVAELGERRDVAVGRAAAQVELARELADPDQRTVGLERREDREAALQRLRRPRASVLRRRHGLILASRSINRNTVLTNGQSPGESVARRCGPLARIEPSPRRRNEQRGVARSHEFAKLGGPVADGRESGRPGPELADRPVRLPEGAERVLELAGRAARLARDLLPLRPVAPHDRPVRQGPRRAEAALRPRRQQLRELRRRTRRSSSSPATPTAT